MEDTTRSAVRIAAPDAERLAREGGVVNRPNDCRTGYCEHARDYPNARWVPFEVGLQSDCGALHGAGQQWCSMCRYLGEARVVDVHHADDCTPHGEIPGCHEGAEPDMWHWTIEPTTGSGDMGDEAAITVTIVTPDADDLVRNGGLANRTEWDEPFVSPTSGNGFVAEVYNPCDCRGTAHYPGRHEESRNPWGFVRVVDVHHADDCWQGPEEYAVWCHPDAKPDYWHWTVEPAAD